MSSYGRSKLAGEIFLKEIWHKHIILRVSWLFGAYGNNFVKNIICLAKERVELNIVSDQKGAPTYAGDVARTLLKIIECVHNGQNDWGSYHYTGMPTTNWYEFACNVVNNVKFLHKLTLKKILPILSLDYSSIAARPYNSELNCGKIAQIFHIKQNIWSEGLKEVVNILS